MSIVQTQVRRLVVSAGVLLLACVAQSVSAQQLCIRTNTPNSDEYAIRFTGASDNYFNMTLKRLDVGLSNYAATGSLLVLPSLASPNRYVMGWTASLPNGLHSYYCAITVVPFPSSDGRLTQIIGGFTPPVTESGSCEFFSCTD